MSNDSLRAEAEQANAAFYSAFENADGPKEWRRAARRLEILIPVV